MKKLVSLLFIVAILIVSLTACGPDSTPTRDILEPSPTDTEALLPTEPPSPTEPPPPTETPLPTEEPALDPLPPEPQEIEFQAEDGESHLGTYYPAAVNPAPMIVLMHWAPGDQRDWTEIAHWLQNRGLGGQSPNSEHAPWLDPSWFPETLEGQSFAIFTFTFRGCEGGCSTFDRTGWLLDAQAAMETAQGLDGVDPQRIVAIGASIGADGAPDGCFWLNTESENSCLGALSLSPGSYLSVPYDDAVDALGAEQPPKPDWCLFAAQDADSARACQSALGDHYRMVEYGGSSHGMMLIGPDIEPNALLLILEFLTLSFGL
ncbi:MAG: hypothetical protein GY832_19840 [Chloroflexi bacterium]|nr:hypothetical protein [Chloroflexota bacterium]